nr:MAG TPA: hypothetical protein [Caudoviricetes sp.]DAI68422.1 MAG TPA: hypothetical protein [Caudoviricetes sp.]
MASIRSCPPRWSMILSRSGWRLSASRRDCMYSWV